MKRYLVTISLIGVITLTGIIYIQLSWLKVNLEQQHIFLNQKMITVLRSVGQHISDELVLKSQQQDRIIKQQHYDVREHERQLFQRQKGYIDLMSVTDVFNLKELDALFKREIRKEGFEGVEYDFGIVKGSIVKLNSMGSATQFQMILKDTTDNKIFGYPINYKLKGKLLNEMDDVEVVYLVMQDTKSYLIKKLYFSIALMLVFSFLLIAALYLSISFILKQEQVETMKTNFINNMTHEFKTPISSIKLATTGLGTIPLEPQSTEDFQYYVGIIKEQNQRMQDMVELILKNALLARGELRLDLTECRLHELLDEVIQKHDMLLHQKNAELVSDLQSDYDVILADKAQLKIALANIIENAIKYSSQRLVLTILTANKDNDIILTIADNGIGMKGEDVKHIFKKFYRADTGNKHNVKGFGLGLSYTKSILDAHKGTISVKSQHHLGTTFTIRLPLYFA